MNADLIGMETPRPSLWLILRVWLSLGAQSFGGGSATLALIRRAVVEQHGWITDAEFVRDWALCRVTPGINLLALTVLIGRRLAGSTGIVLCLLGLLLPSVAITILLTACYSYYKDLPAVRAALHSVLPATVGLGLLTAYQMTVPLLAASRREGKGTLLLGVFLLVGGGLIEAVWHLPVVLVLCAAGATGALFHWQREVRKQSQP